MRKVKYFIFAIAVIVVTASIWICYWLTQNFPDMLQERAVYTVNALDLIKEFENNDSLANIKYAEKILTVQGIVTAVETAGSTTNIKISDTITGSYVIFTFQHNNVNEAKMIRVADGVDIKGSCSGGVRSEILGVEFIAFKRCVLED